MTVAELIIQAQVRSEEIYDEPTWMGFINAALDDLTPVAKMLKRVTIPTLTPSSGTITLTLASYADLLNAHEILTVYYQSTTPAVRNKQLRRVSLSDNFSHGWKLTATELIIQGIDILSTVGTVTVDTYKKLDHVEDVSDVPEIPLQYHQLIVMYMCSLSQQKEEELEDRRDFFGDYLMGKNSMALDRIWETEPQNRKFIRRARIQAAIGQAEDAKRQEV